MTKEERIKELRTILSRKQRKKMTLQQMADDIGTSNQYISMLERGKTVMSDNLLYKICDIYGVNDEWLRTGNGPVFVGDPDPAETALTSAVFDRSAIGAALPTGPAEATESRPGPGERVLARLSTLTDDEWAVLEKALDILTACPRD